MYSSLPICPGSICGSPISPLALHWKSYIPQKASLRSSTSDANFPQSLWGSWQLWECHGLASKPPGLITLAISRFCLLHVKSEQKQKKNPLPYRGNITSKLVLVLWCGIGVSSDYLICTFPNRWRNSLVTPVKPFCQCSWGGGFIHVSKWACRVLYQFVLQVFTNFMASMKAHKMYTLLTFFLHAILIQWHCTLLIDRS